MAALITIKEAAVYLGVHYETVRRYIAKGLLEARWLSSGAIRIERAAIDRFLKAAGRKAL